MQVGGMKKHNKTQWNGSNNRVTILVAYDLSTLLCWCRITEKIMSGHFALPLTFRFTWNKNGEYCVFTSACNQQRLHTGITDVLKLHSVLILTNDPHNQFVLYFLHETIFKWTTHGTVPLLQMQSKENNTTNLSNNQTIVTLEIINKNCITEMIYFLM